MAADELDRANSQRDASRSRRAATTAARSDAFLTPTLGRLARDRRRRPGARRLRGASGASWSGSASGPARSSGQRRSSRGRADRAPRPTGRGPRRRCVDATRPPSVLAARPTELDAARRRAARPTTYARRTARRRPTPRRRDGARAGVAAIADGSPRADAAERRPRRSSTRRPRAGASIEAVIAGARAARRDGTIASSIAELASGVARRRRPIAARRAGDRRARRPGLTRAAARPRARPSTATATASRAAGSMPGERSPARRWPAADLGRRRGRRAAPSRRAADAAARDQGDAAPSSADDRGARDRVTDFQRRRSSAALAGGPERHREKSAEQGKLPVRERVARLLDAGLVRRGGAARQLGAGRASAPTASSPASARSAAGRSR